MSFNNPLPGPSLNEFLVAAIPYVTSSTVQSGSVKEHNFDFVTSFFAIKNKGSASICIGFTRLGVLGTNNVTLSQNESFGGQYRITSLFILGNGTVGTTSVYELAVGLTGILAKNMPVITGSNGFPGVG